jgi:hypothetical protein
MDFTQELHIGFDKTHPAKSLGNLPAPPSLIDTTGGFAGSCHVLEMGRHYTEYVGTGRPVPRLPGVPGLRSLSSIEQLKIKTRAADITGNIGEILAGIVADTTLDLGIHRIAHIKTKKTMQTPDFMLVSTRKFHDFIRANIPLAGRPLPVWWPLESKARYRSIPNSCIKGALSQLFSYWYSIRKEYPAGVGYGIVVASSFSRRVIKIHVFVPKDLPSMRAMLKSSKGTLKGLELNVSKTAYLGLHY